MFPGGPYLSALPGVDAAGVEESHHPGILGRNPENFALRVAVVQGGAAPVSGQWKN